ncbi:MAG: alpha/beta hydrolase [Sphingobium sp.]
MKRDVEFISDGHKLAAMLITPEGEGPFPTIVMAGGWCYVKEIVMPHYAKPIVDAGIACLIFDYRYMGDSEGTPRQHIDPYEQWEDYKNALSFVAEQPECDENRLGIWGISYSGGHVMAVGAMDPRVKAIVSTVPVIEGWETMLRSHGAHGFKKLLKTIGDDRDRRYKGEEGGLIPMSDEPEVGISTWPFGHARVVFEKIQATEAPNHRHESTIHSTEMLLAYNIRHFADKILSTPTMMVVAALDRYTQWDFEIAFFNSLQTTRKELVVLPQVDHLSLYENKSHLEIAGEAHARFLRKYLIEEKY